jgi:hypothetical protein
VKVICGQGTVNGYPAVIEVNGTTYYAYGTTPADQQQGAGIQYVAEGQLPMGTVSLPFPSDPNKVYFVTPNGVQTYDLSVGQQIKALAQQQCGVDVQGQMNAGNVLQAQLQSLSSSVPSTTPVSSASGQAVSEITGTVPSVSEPSTPSETTPAESQPTGQSSLFSNKLLWIGIAIVIIIIIIAVVG